MQDVLFWHPASLNSFSSFLFLGSWMSWLFSLLPPNNNFVIFVSGCVACACCTCFRFFPDYFFLLWRLYVNMKMELNKCAFFLSVLVFFNREFVWACSAVYRQWYGQWTINYMCDELSHQIALSKQSDLCYYTLQLEIERITTALAAVKHIDLHRALLHIAVIMAVSHFVIDCN